MLNSGEIAPTCRCSRQWTMPEDDAQQRQAGTGDQSNATDSATPRRRDWKNAFRLPKPLKELFEKFPLVTYAANSDPLGAPSSRNKHTLYVFTSEKGAIDGAPSFNPSCLKWQVSSLLLLTSEHELTCTQAYLKFHGTEFRTVSSNNHASPTGVLPFLLPAHASSSEPSRPIASNRIERWAQGDNDEAKTNIRAVTHLALINHNLRRAWVRLTSNSYHSVDSVLTDRSSISYTSSLTTFLPWLSVSTSVRYHQMSLYEQLRHITFAKRRSRS